MSATTSDAPAAPTTGGRQLLNLLATVAARTGAAPPPSLNRSADGGDPPSMPPQAAIDWLAELTLLYGVPFEYLVPVSGMLPPESIRFFFVDRNWTNSLIDGAASVAVGSSLDQVIVDTTLETVVQEAAVAARGVRGRLLGRGTPAPGGAPVGAVTGFLLRSAAVSGWPGLEVVATDAQGASLVPPLRFERLSPDILLCLLDGMPVDVEIRQPSETLHFGVIQTEHGSPQTTLRHVVGAEVGQQIGEQVSAVAMRGGNAPSGVLRIDQTAATLLAGLVAAGELPASATLTSGQFAIQMVQGAGLQPFRPQPPAAAPALPKPTVA